MNNSRLTMHEQSGYLLAESWRDSHAAQLIELGVAAEFTTREPGCPVLRLSKGAAFVDASLDVLGRYTESEPVRDVMRRCIVQLMGDWTMRVLK